jgi:hypothetical protein
MNDTMDGIKVAALGPLGLLPTWLIGLFIFAIGGWLAYLRLPYLTQGVRCEGVVVEFDERPIFRPNDGKFVKKYFPVVAYTVDGARHKYQFEDGETTRSYELGDKVSLIVLPDRPDEATVASFASIWLAPSLFLSVGTAVLLFAAVVGMAPRTSKGDLFKEAQYLWNVQRNMSSGNG